MRYTVLILALIVHTSCTSPTKKSIGSIERLDPALDTIISGSATIEIIAEGFDWSEGPLWIEAENMLLFSDVPRNTIYKWTVERGSEVYLTPSGFTGIETKSNEPGSNGLLLDDEGYLVLCQHGDRRLAIMNAPHNDPKPIFTTLADKFNGKRFNSPNDAVLLGNDYYFTDPPYGLPQQTNDPNKEIPFQGIYKVFADGSIKLLVDSLTRPNGLAFTPDGKLIVANSDPKKARWYQFELSDTAVISGRIFFDATNLNGTDKGLPDGLKIDSHGNIFATGPGGVWIFNSTGKVLGKLKLPEATSNCALSPDEKTLYITADMYVLRVKLR